MPSAQGHQAALPAPTLLNEAVPTQCLQLGTSAAPAWRLASMPAPQTTHARPWRQPPLPDMAVCPAHVSAKDATDALSPPVKQHQRQPHSAAAVAVSSALLQPAEAPAEAPAAFGMPSGGDAARPASDAASSEAAQEAAGPASQATGLVEPCCAAEPAAAACLESGQVCSVKTLVLQCLAQSWSYGACPKAKT